MNLRVAGSSFAVPRPGSACSCYLVESGGARIILDCGTGAVQSLRRLLDPLELDAAIISHFHPDHVFDLVPLRYLFAFAPEERRRMLDVHVHPGGDERVHTLAAAALSGEGERFFERSMRIHEYDPASTLQISDLRITFARTKHYVEAYAVRIENGGKSVVYSADTAPCDSVVALARGADLFVCECSLGARATDSEPRGHCNASEAGAMAREAGAKHLLLTHYGEEHAPDALASAAASEYRGKITVARDGMTLPV